MGQIMRDHTKLRAFELADDPNYLKVSISRTSKEDGFYATL
jgi:hypothetical protein